MIGRIASLAATALLAGCGNGSSDCLDAQNKVTGLKGNLDTLESAYRLDGQLTADEQGKLDEGRKTAQALQDAADRVCEVKGR